MNSLRTIKVDELFYDNDGVGSATSDWLSAIGDERSYRMLDTGAIICSARDEMAEFRLFLSRLTPTEALIVLLELGELLTYSKYSVDKYYIIALINSLVNMMED